MVPSDYTVQDHIAELRRAAAQQKLAREVRTHPMGDQPKIVARWLNRLLVLLRRPQRRQQPALQPAPCARLPELCIEDAWC